MSKQTAVEWLIVQIINDHNNNALTGVEWKKIFEQAKAMEHEQLEKAYKKGCMDEIDKRIESCVEESYKTDYNETYKK